jgi:hypothetical protein
MQTRLVSGVGEDEKEKQTEGHTNTGRAAWQQVGRLRRPTLPDLRAGGCAARKLSYQPLDPANRGGCCRARDVKANRARQPAGQRRGST